MDPKRTYTHARAGFIKGIVVRLAGCGRLKDGFGWSRSLRLAIQVISLSGKIWDRVERLHIVLTA